MVDIPWFLFCIILCLSLHKLFVIFLEENGEFTCAFFSGHFGCIELPIPIYHPSHVSELKRILSLVCLKCLKMKSNKVCNGRNVAIWDCCLGTCICCIM